MKPATLIMYSSAIFMGIVGILLTFIPNEIFELASGITPSPFQILILQLGGALYFGMAMINWYSKNQIIGGLFGRAVGIGNYTHFLIASLGLLKSGLLKENYYLMAFTMIYVIFALGFTWMFFTTPKK